MGVGNARLGLGVVGLLAVALIVGGLAVSVSGQVTPPPRPGEGLPEEPMQRPTEKLLPEFLAPEVERVAKPKPVAAQELIKTWPGPARRAAAAMIEQHGQPHEATDTMLIWQAVAPWKRVVVWRDPVWVIEQVIDYRVPDAKLADLARFDGGIVVDRTRGELSVRSESQETNRLSLNLAHDLVRGKRSVGEARRLFAETAAPAKAHPYKDKLQFEVPTGD
jgi:hypothetical protein